MLSALKIAQDALARIDLVDLKIAEAQAYTFSRFITLSENLQKHWDSHFDTLNNSYADIFKFL